MGYAGQTCGRAQELVADQVIPAWPIAEHTGLLDITHFLDGELLSDLACPARCLKPVSEWPTHPPKGVVMASDGEWYKLAVVGIERGLFAVIDERDIMRDMDGALILNEAMGVKKLKEHADGTVTQLQRFITNLVPMNSYLRRLRGDSGLLPSVGRLGLIQLEADETLEIDSEDMVSAINLFRMPVAWRGAFTYAKQVPASVCPGGDPNTKVYLAITTVPMGWVGCRRQLRSGRVVFSTTRARTASCVWMGSTLCPGFARQARAEMGPVRHDSARRAWRSGSKRCAQRWASRCTRGKGWSELRVAPFWGAEVDGERGYVRHGRKKGHALVLSTLLLLGTPRWTVTPLQHCVGLITFAAGFRRPLFALFESVYKDITDHDDFRPFSPSDTAVTELLLAAFCVPLAAVDLRSPIRPVISTSDASHAGGGAAEARSFRPNPEPSSASAQRGAGRGSERGSSIRGERVDMPPLLLQRCWQLRDGAVPVAVWIWLVLSPMLCRPHE